jgi:hypothetical protein
VKVAGSSSLNRNETFVTVKQSNTGCPRACYDCSSGLDGTTEGGLALVIGTDDVEVCDGYCSGYGYCGGRNTTNPQSTSLRLIALAAAQVTLHAKVDSRGEASLPLGEHDEQAEANT